MVVCEIDVLGSCKCACSLLEIARTLPLRAGGCRDRLLRRIQELSVFDFNAAVMFFPTGSSEALGVICHKIEDANDCFAGWGHHPIGGDVSLINLGSGSL